jgi:hypothetical protein
LFSRYALGQINKSELVSNVRQAQTARKEKKGEEVQYWVMNKDGTGGKQMVFAASETAAIILGGKQMGMNREQSISQLKAELFKSEEIGDAAPASLSQSWKDWVEETLPTVTVDTANSVRQRVINGGDNLDADASGWIVKQIDAELRSRMDQGVVDGNETRWKVYFARGRHVDQDPVFVDADSPRQAKLKAADIFMREQRISVGLHDLEAIATTQDAGRPEVTWNIINGLGEPAGTVNARTSDEALHVYGSVNNVDTRYYRATPAETTPSAGTYTSFADAQAAADRANAGGAENAVRDSLPQAHRDWLDNVADKSDMDLINVLRNVSTTAVLNDQQTAYFRVIIKRELRRRGISGERDASEQGATPVQQELPLEPTVAQTTATDFEVVKADGSVVSRIQGADMVYAHRKARELEQDLGLESGALTVRALPTQANESIKQLRRLAGLK